MNVLILLLFFSLIINLLNIVNTDDNIIFSISIYNETSDLIQQYDLIIQLNTIIINQILIFCDELYLNNESCNLIIENIYHKIESHESIPNPHLLRYNGSINAELSNEEYNWNHIINTISNQLSIYLYSNLHYRSICFIHSVLLTNEYPNILNELIQSIVINQLINELDVIFILHYGIPLTNSFISSLPYNFIYIYISDNTKSFEIPTLRIVKQVMEDLFMYIDKEDNDIYILYIHTKGISYIDSNLTITISKWREMMLYYLITRFKTNYYILKSKLFDVIGCEYHSYDRHISGNYWWSSGRYIASNSLNILNNKSNKYEAEKWILSGVLVRVYSPFITEVRLSINLLESFVYIDINNKPKRYYDRNQIFGELFVYTNSTHCIGYQIM